MNAARSLYSSPNLYVESGTAHHAATRALSGLWNNVDINERCDADSEIICVRNAITNHSDCLRSCRTGPCKGNLAPASGCAECNKSCNSTYDEELADCRLRFGCTSGTCKLDYVAGWPTTCCLGGTEPCRSICRPICESGKTRDLETCECKCINTVCTPLGTAKVVNPQTCQCECPNTCPPDKVQDGVTCQCLCDDRMSDLCDGRCTNLSSSTSDCGACGRACMPGEICCQGVCVEGDHDPNCGYCGADCSGIGRTCCNNGGQFFCTTLTENENCGACNNVCVAPRTCVQDSGVFSCLCPTGNPDCGDGICCDGNCCGGKCRLSASYQSDKANCGSCGNACGPGHICVNGACVCSGGRTDCAGVCKDLRADIKNCGSCGSACPTVTTCSNSSPPVCITDQLICVNGSCVCPSGKLKCGERCCPPNLPSCVILPVSGGTCCPSGAIGMENKDANGNTRWGCCPSDWFFIPDFRTYELTCCAPSNVTSDGIRFVCSHL